MKISFFSNAFTAPKITTTVSDELFNIKNGAYKDQIIALRDLLATNQNEEYKKKKKLLPAVTFSGLFNENRRINNIEQYSNTIILDYDNLNKEEVSDFKKEISNNIHVYAVWTSPSEKGLKVLIKTTNTLETHKNVYNSLVNYFEENYNRVLDYSGSDITRLCFTSYDPDLYLNENSIIWDENKTIEYDIQTKNGLLIEALISNDKKPIPLSNLVSDLEIDNDRNKLVMRKAIKYLKKTKQSITSDYDSWYKVAYAISSSFTYKLGEKYFLDLCELDQENYSKEKSISILEYCYRNNRKLINMNTIVYYSHQKGFDFWHEKNKKDQSFKLLKKV